MDEVNDAIIRRVRVVPFTSKFVDESVYNALEQDDIKENNIFKGNVEPDLPCKGKSQRLKSQLLCTSLFL
jgi:hypothetical protein